MKKITNHFKIIALLLISFIFLVPAASTSAAPSQGTGFLLRYYNGVDHFYTTSINFDADLVPQFPGYNYEKYMGGVYTTFKYTYCEPIYKYYNGVDHFYTSNWNELGNGANGYTYQGIAFYGVTNDIGKNSCIPIYRYYNGVDHFYTSNWNELGSGTDQWHYEGIAFNATYIM